MPRAGKKRSDRRWIDEDGNVWASKLEYQVYSALREAPGIAVLERCERGGRHSYDYATPVRGGTCSKCSSRDVVQQRVYTPDLFVVPASRGDNGAGYYIEVKGHLRADRRALLRSFLKARPDFDLRFILQRNGSATSKLDLGEYIEKYYKCPWHVWDGRIPKSWTT